MTLFAKIKNVLRKVKRKVLQTPAPVQKVAPINEPNSRMFLLNKMPANAVCAEIGSWKGDFSQTILKETNPKKVYLVDPYAYVADYEGAWYGGTQGSQAMMDEIHQSVAERFATEIKEDKLEIIRNNSEDGFKDFENHTFDWVYIDGNHLYEFVKKDLYSSWDKVKIGGFLTGDDYGLVGWWDNGVTKAVDEFIEVNRASLGYVLIKDTQFILEKIKD